MEHLGLGNEIQPGRIYHKISGRPSYFYRRLRENVEFFFGEVVANCASFVSEVGFAYSFCPEL
jgi:hypothetical protein